MRTKSYEMDMCSGPLAGKMLSFSVPLIFSGVLQLLFNAMDMIVVGQCAGPNSLAAVGSTASLINLLINVFVGLSVGANVLIARYYGAGKEKDVSTAVHTAITMSLICGFLLTIVGLVASRQILIWMGTPKEVLGLATLYMRVYFLGMPVVMLYNFGSAVLRAIGDTKRPLYFLLLAGLINVGLNLFFVIQLNMDVAGVAAATVISQCVSSGLIVWCLMRTEGSCHLDIHKLSVNREKAFMIIRTGLPAGMQGVIFSLSNVLIQSSVNSFGPVAMAGNSAASSVEGFVYTSMNAYYQTALNFTSQNFGAGKNDRIRKVLQNSLLMVTVVGLVMGFAVYGLAEPLLEIYSSKPAVIHYGVIRLSVIVTTYFLCGIMDTMVGILRGLGYSVMPMMVSLLGACGIRILWLVTVFQRHRSLFVLYLSYPVSWLITFCVHFGCYIYVVRKIAPCRKN